MTMNPSRSIPVALFALAWVWPALVAGAQSPASTVSEPPGPAQPFPRDGFASQPAAWFRGEQALRYARNVLTYQTPDGGWPKNIDMLSGPRSQRVWDYEEGRSVSLADPEKFRLSALFDNNATIPQIRFLGRMYLATGRREFKDAYSRGIEYILRSQYDSGGWPQRYPDLRGYYANITFNDNAMTHVMEFLRDLLAAPDPQLVNASQLAQLRRAFDRGLECILRCQVRIDGRLTAWCAQHDPVTLAPAKGRRYEPVSLSGGESAEILIFLISLPDPDPRVQRAIHAAAAWFERSKIAGLRVERVGGEFRVVADPLARPCWARFYEIPTGRPIFSGRDGVIRYQLDQVEPERRNGYAWYGYWGEKALRKYRAWCEAPGRAKSATPSSASAPATRPEPERATVR